jgi:hypothetical protein
MLNRNKFLLIEKKFGLHQFDLMSLDSNVMQDKDGKHPPDGLGPHL